MTSFRLTKTTQPFPLEIHNAYGLWTRKNGYPVKLADEGKEKESEVDE